MCGREHSLTDRRRISCTILAPPNVCLHIGRRDDLNLMTQCHEFSRPKMRRAASLNANQAGLHAGEKSPNLGTTKTAANNDVTRHIDPMYLKDVFG